MRCERIWCRVLRWRRALLAGLTDQQTDAPFTTMVDASIRQIFDASVTR